MYYRGAKAAVVVYDITQKDTLNGAKSWIDELKKRQANCVIILVGNKVDLNEEREIVTSDVKEYARDHDLIHIEASAKTGHNVKNIFNKICQKMEIEPTEEYENTILQPDLITKSTKFNNCC